MMKSSVYAIVMAFFLSISLGGFSADVEAKRFGGGKSFGKSFSVPKSSTSPTSTAAAGNRSGGLLGGGLMGGLMGGLLAGGLFAALMGGAFDGLAFGDILLFALVGFLIYKLFIAPKRQQAMANEAGSRRQMHRRQMNGDTIHGDNVQAGTGSFFDRPSIQLPSNFNQDAFLAEAKNHYAGLQKAWDENNFDEIEEYVSSELLVLLQSERVKLGSDKPITDVISLSVELVRGELLESIASITLLFSGRIKEGEQVSDNEELWHLEKNMEMENTNWVIVGIQQDY